MTPAEQKRAAKSARKLAMEIVNGRRLKLVNYSYCGCAAHYVAEGAGLADRDGDNAMELAGAIMLPSEDFDPDLLSAATTEVVRGADQTALVFPLLATADALDELARSAP